jgi:toxin ParE1/3/4
VKVVWTPRAARDLEEITDYIGTDSPASAVKVADRIFTQAMELVLTPRVGRIGEVPDTRELVFHPWPYIAVYRIVGAEIRILRVRHASQSWP